MIDDPVALPNGWPVRRELDIEIFIAPIGYKAYHGTDSANVESILAHGLRSRDGFTTVCFTERADVCEDFGDATIEADLSGLLVERFWDEGDEGGVWEVQAAGPIEPARLRRYEVIK